MKNRHVEMSLVVGIIFLFIVSSVPSMVVNYDADTMEMDECLENLAFVYYDEYGSSELEYCSDCLRRERFDVEEDVTQRTESPQTELSAGPMDSPWPMKCHDTCHTGLSPYGTVDNPYDELWKFETEGWMNSGIILDDEGTLYFGSHDFYLYAVYPNGTLKWKYKTDMWITSAPAIAEDGTVYVGSWDHYLHAIHPNGTRKWRFHAEDAIASSPAIAEDGTIYFGTMGDGYRIFAINPDGMEKWRYQTGYKITSDPAIGNDGTVYIGSGDTYLYALYPNGTLRWRFKTGHYVKGPPSIADDGTIYIGSWDDYLYALYPNGTMKWQHGVGAGTESNPSIGPDGTIYVGGGYLYAIYPNGARRWTFDFGSNRHSHQSSPAICADGTIYISLIIGDDQGGEILAVNPDGTERWRKWLADNEGQSSPSIGSDGTVYVGSSFFPSGNSYGYVHAFNRGELDADAHGPYIGIMNEPVQFTGSADGGYPPYSYHWNFGDDNISDEQNPTHEYASAGNYTVTFTVTDDNDTVAVDTTWALIRESNDPPSTPSIDGETEGNYGEPYDYTFITTDPDGDDVWYYIEWGDGDTEEWIGPYSSGEEVVRSHAWGEQGDYTIRAKAKDIFNAESDWGTLEVTMPVNQQYQYPLFHWFLEMFPNAFPMLRNLLGRLNI